MKVPYFIVKQKKEEFFVMKFKATELKDKLDFHFREPYSNSDKDKVSYIKYIERIKKKGLEISSDQEGVQRRVQLNRINKISSFLNGQEDSYLPNSVVLAADVSNEEQFVSMYLENPDLPEFGEIVIPDTISFQIIDGQHRLAGLYISDQAIQDSFELFAVVLFNATKHTCAKLFRDINGNQMTVNKSGLFDLLDLVEVDDTDKDLQIEKNIHVICKQFNEIFDSPLYGHIKMMGLGSGAISQAFFIQRVKKALDELDIDISEESIIQNVYDSLFYYFSAFQRVFPEDWPIVSQKQFEAGKLDEKFKQKYPEINNLEFSEVRDMYSYYILKIKKSQLLKTNGFGAILKLYPVVYKKIKGNDFVDYVDVISKLSGKINWSEDEILTSGTGVKNSNLIAERLIKYVNE